jgi:hypothetical protein
MPCTTPSPHTLSAYKPDTLIRRYRNLPRWVISAFFEIKHAKDYMLSPEARALLNIAILPMPGCKYDEDHDTLLDCNVEVKDLFVDEESYRENKEHVDLCKLSKDMTGLWKH